MGCIVYRPLCLRMYFTFVGIEGEIIYLHWRGAFGVVSALYIERRYFLFVTYLIISRYRKAQT